MLAVVTINFNNLDGLKKTYESLVAQTNQDFDWVVVDGGSLDGSVEFLRGISCRLHFISEPDSGIYDAMHKGLCMVRKEYVLFLNSGDILLDSFVIESILPCLGVSDVYFFGCRIVGLWGNYLRFPLPLTHASYSVPAVQQATFYRKEVLVKIEWPRRYKICGDYAIAVQLLTRGSSYTCDSFLVAEFELGGVSTAKPLMLAREAYAIQGHYLNIPFIARFVFFLRRYFTGILVYCGFYLRRAIKRMT